MAVETSSPSGLLMRAHKAIVGADSVEIRHDPNVDRNFVFARHKGNAAWEAFTITHESDGLDEACRKVANRLGLECSV